MVGLGWGDWLSHLGYLPGVKHVVVTVHTDRVRRHILWSQPAPGKRAWCRRSSGSWMTISNSRVRRNTPAPLVSITVDVPDRSHLESAGSDLVELCSALGSTLGRCGVSVLCDDVPTGHRAVGTRRVRTAVCRCRRQYALG